MTTRTASCRCGQLKATATGDPVRVSVCHCLDCQKRTGSAFSAQARWPAEQVDDRRHSRRPGPISPTAATGSPIISAPTAGRPSITVIEGKFDGLVAIPLGAFDDPYFLKPRFSVWEERKHDWVEILGRRRSSIERTKP